MFMNSVSKFFHLTYDSVPGLARPTLFIIKAIWIT